MLKVPTPIWQETVTGFAAESAIALIDVSEPTENVLWEIEHLTRTLGQRCVFVGQYERVGGLSRPAPATSTTGRLQQLLDGRQILAYTTDAAGTRRFTKALRATFERASGNRSGPRSAGPARVE